MTCIAQLCLTDFRSYTDVLIAPGPGFVVLVGDNGAGKTNVLESLSLLSPGRGLRRASLLEIARDGGPGGFAVAARLTKDTDGGNAPVEIGTGTTPAAPERRQVRINGAPASANSLSEWLSVLWLTPAMDRLFGESASGRRQFFDRLVLALEPGHASHVARYEAAMRARNKLLAQPDMADPAWLAALETEMARYGTRLAEARERTEKALSQSLAAQPDGPFARAGLALEHWCLEPEGAEDALRLSLQNNRGKDVAAGRALVGPHRTDIRVMHLGKGQPADRCSTGEQKALLLAIVLAHADLVAERAGQRPILLLDEVAAHLDFRCRAALFERLAASGGQVWMTGTESSLFEAIRGRANLFSVVDKKIIVK